MINIIKIYTSQYFRFSSFWHPNSFILDEDAAYRYLDIYLVFPIIQAPMKRKKPLSNLRRDDMKKKKKSVHGKLAIQKIMIKNTVGLRESMQRRKKLEKRALSQSWNWDSLEKVWLQPPRQWWS